jgi:hypothetical protein
MENKYLDSFVDELTEDIQHDLAMAYCDNDHDDCTQAMELELKKRNEPLPYNCKWEYSPYALFKKQLKYDV